MWHMHEGHYWGMHWWWWIFWAMTFGIAFILLRKNRSRKEESAMDILKKRFARGEIDQEEFEARKRVLLDES